MVPSLLGLGRSSALLPLGLLISLISSWEKFSFGEANLSRINFKSGVYPKISSGPIKFFSDSFTQTLKVVWCVCIINIPELISDLLTKSLACFVMLINCRRCFVLNERVFVFDINVFESMFLYC